MSRPSVHVLVINWNGLEHLEACFDTLLANPYPEARFILVDNASTDESVAFVESRYGHDPRVRVLRCPANLGWSGGNNAGIRASLAEQPDYLVLLNNDTAVAPDLLEKLVAAAEANPAIGALAPKLLLYHTPALLNSVGLYCSRIASSWDIGIGRLNGPAWDTPQRVIGVCGAGMLLRTAALEKTGLLPEEFDIYLDDLDLCLRLWNAGYEIWSCPAAVIRHKFSATWGQGPRVRHKYFLNTRNRIWVILRQFPLVRLPETFAWFLLGEVRAIGRAVLSREAWRVWAHVRAWGAGLAYVPQALAERRRQRKAGGGACQFWPLLHRGRMFSAGVELPEDGWYAPRQIHGETVRPMSAFATCTIPAGSLRVFHANCYPRAGATEVVVRLGDQSLGVLSTRDAESVQYETAGGELCFEARRIFPAETTGERVDLGGWIGVHAGDSSGRTHGMM
jgi:GT2 family glycosyltransferase